MMPGFGELMRSVFSNMWLPLSFPGKRPVSGTKPFIVNLPGKPKAIRQCLDAVFAIPYCIDLLEDSLARVQ